MTDKQSELLYSMNNFRYEGAAMGTPSGLVRYERRAIRAVSRGRSPLYPPSWFVRIVKGAMLAAPGVFFVLVVTLLSMKVSQPSVVTFTEDFEDYVQRLGLCRNGSRLPDSGVAGPSPALGIYRACRRLEAMEREYYSRRADVVNAFNATFRITGSGICDRETDAVLLVHSHHGHFDRRKAIRETWGGATVQRRWPGARIDECVRMAFVFGQNRNADADLAREAEIYGDIVQGDFVDDYRNMTLKSLLGLKWVAEHCSAARYVIKSDDDMIINFPHLLAILRQTDMTWSIMGPLNAGAKVYRTRSKWALSKEHFPFYYFPPYESGSAYVISADLVRPLLQCSHYVPHIFIDDVYVTGILGRILRVRHKRQSGFAYWTDSAPNACDIINNKLITGTKMKPQRQYALWKEITAKIHC